MNFASLDAAKKLSPLVVNGRDKLVRTELQRVGASSGSALLVVDLNNIRWLTGFTGSAGTLIVRPDDMVLVVDGRYGDQAREQIRNSGANCEVVEGRSAVALREALANATKSIAIVHFDSGELTVGQLENMTEQLSSELRKIAPIVPKLRRRKTEPEIERMQLAALATDFAMAEVVPMLSQGLTERDIRDELDYRMRRHGAEFTSYDTIVASGPNAARPHHRPVSRRIETGDSVVIDVGGLVDGYHSDMTRTYLIGDVDPVLSEMHEVVSQSQLLGLAAVKAGVMAQDVDKTCRDYIAEAGFASEFTHSTGHGVGLQIHEMPWVRTGFAEPLEVGEVVTVEPGVYREGLGGVRIEDLVVVTQSGCRILTSSKKDRQCLQLQPTT
ncbi:MAG: Xaa-Pro peptidase family protein [Ilumatobacteraceae bacterium]|nr:Xaa-Pro peptidase family protein [Ilumatobacteraceae bacterium]